MPVKIRLQRHGSKGFPFYHIVIADSRAPRDGKFIERIGSYNPTTNPATIKLDFDLALSWLKKGAQPTDTCRGILSYEGVMMKHHLLKGVAKNAMTENEAEVKFNTWKKDKDSKIDAKRSKLSKSKDEEATQRLAAEAKVREAKAEAIAKKNAKLAAAAKAESAAATEEAEVVENTEAVVDTTAENTAEA
jgi:small subunit ribosomal protein S16